LSSIASKAKKYAAAIADILNNQQIGRVYELYRHNAVWHRSVGDYYGRDTIVREYTRWLAAFPDLSYRCEDVIWVDHADDGMRMLERFEWSATHRGHGIFGPPTGQSVSISGLRLSHWRQGRILAEWLHNDQLNLIRQLGMDPAQAHQRLHRYARPDFQWVAGEGEIAHTRGQTTPAPWPESPTEGRWPEFIAETLVSKIFNWRLLNSVDEIIARDCRFDLANGAGCEDLDGFKAYVLNRLALSSDLTVLIDEIFWEQKSESRFKIGLRWKMFGSHDGCSSYGAPANARFCIPGLTMLETRDNRIVGLVERFGEIVFSPGGDTTTSDIAESHNAHTGNDESEHN